MRESHTGAYPQTLSETLIGTGRYTNGFKIQESSYFSRQNIVFVNFLGGTCLSLFSQVAQVRNIGIGDHRHCCITISAICMEKKTCRFRNVRKWQDFNKKQLTLHKMCVMSLLGVPWADLWPFYGLYRHVTMPMLANAPISSLVYLWHSQLFCGMN